MSFIRRTTKINPMMTMMPNSFNMPPMDHFPVFDYQERKLTDRSCAHHLFTLGSIESSTANGRRVRIHRSVAAGQVETSGG